MIYLALLFNITGAMFLPINTIDDLPLAQVSQLGEACGFNPSILFTVMCVDGLECSNMGNINGVCRPASTELDDFYSCVNHRRDVIDLLDHSHLSGETIWLPDCQEDNEKLYKKHQCHLKQFGRSQRNHRKKLHCFRVDEFTGQEEWKNITNALKRLNVESRSYFDTLKVKPFSLDMKIKKISKSSLCFSNGRSMWWF